MERLSLEAISRILSITEKLKELFLERLIFNCFQGCEQNVSECLGDTVASLNEKTLCVKDR